MTAEELLNEKYEGNSVWGDLRTHSDVFYEPDVVEAMQEYAKIKCKELLEIVMEKAKVEEVREDYYVNKESIFNAVNLDKFIK